MQYDVKSGHLNVAGFFLIGRTRLKGLMTVSSGASAITLWDTATVPVTATYERDGTLITVTENGHGLTNGQTLGLNFAVATLQGTAGNYVISVLNANTFTVTDVNTGTINAGTACVYAQRFLMAADGNAAGNVQTILIPGEGILALNGIYLSTSGATGVTVFYG
jgi:hypothetical protein